MFHLTRIWLLLLALLLTACAAPTPTPLPTDSEHSGHRSPPWFKNNLPANPAVPSVSQPNTPPVPPTVDRTPRRMYYQELQQLLYPLPPLPLHRLQSADFSQISEDRVVTVSQLSVHHFQGQSAFPTRRYATRGLQALGYKQLAFSDNVPILFSRLCLALVSWLHQDYKPTEEQCYSMLVKCYGGEDEYSSGYTTLAALPRLYPLSSALDVHRFISRRLPNLSCVRPESRSADKRPTAHRST